MNRTAGLIAIVLAFGLITGLAVSGRLDAQPGSESDPAVSLSYLEASQALAPVTLEGGEEFTIKSGKTVVLLEGSARLIPSDKTKCWIVDVKSGTVENGNVEMSAGGYYLLISNDPETKFQLQTWKNSIIALPGGSGQ